MLRTILPMLPALMLSGALCASEDEVHVLSADCGTCTSVTAGDGYTDERTVASDQAQCDDHRHHHRRHRHHDEDEVQYGWDGVAYEDGCGGPAVRVAVMGPLLPPPHVAAPLVACIAHAGVVHGLATVGVVALKLAAIPLLLPFALHR